MKDKNNLYWLKGGIIFLIISFLYHLIQLVIHNFDKDCYPIISKSCNFYNPDSISLIIPPTMLENFSRDWNYFLPYIIKSLIIWFIIGIIIGYIYRKYKKNKN